VDNNKTETSTRTPLSAGSRVNAATHTVVLTRTVRNVDCRSFRTFANRRRTVESYHSNSIGFFFLPPIVTNIFETGYEIVRIENRSRASSSDGLRRHPLYIRRSVYERAHVYCRAGPKRRVLPPYRTRLWRRAPPKNPLLRHARVSAGYAARRTDGAQLTGRHTHTGSVD